MRIRVFLVLLLALSSGCKVVPETAPRRPWFDADPDLLAKEGGLWAETNGLVDRSGLLIYDATLPWSDDEEKYLKSHDVADQPAWHGCLMAALAFKEAVSKEDQDEDLLRLAKGLRSYFDTTGVEGLLGRSAIHEYSGPRLDWMDTEEDRPTKFWMQGPKGAWYRNGLAKNHLNLAMFGCSVPLTLERKGAVSLRPETREVLSSVLVACVRRLVADGYRITDADGEPTEFGDLRPAVVPAEYVEMAKPFVSWLPWDIGEDDLEKLSTPLNGFNMTIVLAMLRAAGHHDEALARRYEEEAPEWRRGIKLSLRVLGFVVSRVGHYRVGKPSYSDVAAYGQAALALLLDDPDEETADAVKSGLKGIWEFAEFERNPMIAFPYSVFVDPSPDRIEELVQDLRDFPDSKQAAFGPREETKETQPLANRDISSHYWKSSPNERVTGPQEKQEGRFYSAQDYLLAYWAGRYFGLVPEK